VLFIVNVSICNRFLYISFSGLGFLLNTLEPYLDSCMKRARLARMDGEGLFSGGEV
jgi:hypothetical protein